MIIDGQSRISDIGATQSVTTAQSKNNTAVQVASPVPAGPPQPFSSAARSSDAISQFHDWAILADVQSNLADVQASEYSLASAYRQFSSLLQQLGRTPPNELANDLQRWYTLFQQNGVLDRQLRPTVLQNNPSEFSYVLEKADLLSTRPKDETITFFFRDTRTSVSITLPGQASPEELLQRLQQGLRGEGIRLSLNAKGQLVFGVEEENRTKLDRPIQISGEGYRIPAGNPLTVKFQLLPGIIEQFLAQLMTLQPTEYSNFLAEIERYRRQMRAMIGQLRRLRQQLMHQMDQHPFSQEEEPDIDQLAELQAAIQQAFAGEGYRAATQLLGAQANLSRRNVMALLEE